MEQTIDLSTVVLESGSHAPGAGYCIEELVSALAGERWSDAPACVSPVIAAYCRVLNDRWPHELRQRLIPFAARQIGTRDGRDLARAYLCADAAVRVFAPLALEAAGLVEQAATLRALPPVTDRAAAAAASADASAAYAAAAADAAAATHAAYAASAASAASADAAASAASADAASDAVYAAASDAAASAVYAVASDAAAASDALALLGRLCDLGRDEAAQ